VSRFQAATGNGNELIITLPDKQPQLLELSSLENALMKALLHQPGRCSEEALMRAAWGKFTSKQVLTQRLFHLRKKLREACGEEMIENIYGGSYTLKHPEWFSWQ
jgi:DNA-binding response OmpR family regulator